MGTDLRAAAQQALEALTYVTRHFTRAPSTLKDSDARAMGHEAINALRAALEQPNECQWLQEGDEESDTWAASCGRHRYFTLNEGTPKDNHMGHCCYCGKPLVEVSIEEDEA